MDDANVNVLEGGVDGEGIEEYALRPAHPQNL
jgi:hypothetical protein